MTDIHFIPTHELMDEVASRFDHSLFIGLAKRTDATSGTYRRWQGNHHVLAGLAADVQAMVLSELHQGSTWTDHNKDKDKDDND